MSIRLMTLVFKSKLPTTEKFVLLSMADYASDSGESIFPSVETLSCKTSLTRRGVQKSIKGLLDKGYLVLVERQGGRKGTNLYRISVDKLEEVGGEQDSGVNVVLEPANVVPEGVNVVRPGGERSSPNPLLNHQLTIINHDGEMLRSNAGLLKVEHFPQDTWNILSKVCELWKLSPPSKREKRYSFWVSSGRDLQDACGEWGVDLLNEVYESWKEHTYMVSSPSSLINSAAGIAGRKRGSENIAPSVDIDLSYRWNSELSEEDNLRLMRETIARVKGKVERAEDERES